MRVTGGEARGGASSAERTGQFSSGPPWTECGKGFSPCWGRGSPEPPCWTCSPDRAVSASRLSAGARHRWCLSKEIPARRVDSAEFGRHRVQSSGPHPRHRLASRSETARSGRRPFSTALSPIPRMKRAWAGSAWPIWPIRSCLSPRSGGRFGTSGQRGDSLWVDEPGLGPHERVRRDGPLLLSEAGGLGIAGAPPSAALQLPPSRGRIDADRLPPFLYAGLSS